MRKITFNQPMRSKCRIEKWRAALITLAAILSVSLGFAQTTGTIGIGSGTSTTTSFPISSCWGYSYSQQIVSASEFAVGSGVAGPITKIRFYFSSDSSTTPAPATWNNWTVYIGETSKTAFTSASDWEPVANLTQVFTGTITATAGNWMELTLSQPFNYNGTSNLIVAVDENAPDYSCSANWGGYTSTSNSGIYYRSDSTNPNPASPPNASGRTATVARIQFEGSLASCLTPSALAVAAAGTSQINLSWSAPAVAPAAGYDYYVSTTNTAPTATTTPSGSVAAGVTTATVTSLTANTQYYVWIRSKCSTSASSSWVGSASATTFCDALNVPYTQDFESVTTPAIPSCTLIQNAGNGNNWATTSPGAYGFTSKALSYSYNSANAGNAWFYIQALNLTAGISYRITYRYGNNSGASYPEKLKVAFGNAPVNTAMTTVIFDHTNIINNTAATNTVDFTPATSGVYYIGFNAYSAADMNALFVDDINVNLTPTCFPPSAITSSAITETGVTLAWTAAEATPSEGYQVYYSTSATAPTAATVANATATGLTTTLTGLQSGTKYYVWIRGNCGTSNGVSAWSAGATFTTLCDAPDVLTTTPGTVCGIGTTTLAATASGGTLKWYEAATGGASLFTGANFTTPQISETKTYYVAAVNIGTAVSGLGRLAPAASATGTTASDYGVAFTLTTDIVLNSVDVYLNSTTAGNVVMKLVNNAGATLQTATIAVPAGNATTPVQFTLPLGWSIPSGAGYKLTAVSGPSMIRETSGVAFPYELGLAGNITAGFSFGSTTSTAYYYFYNWSVTADCASARTAVLATVTAAPAVTATTTDNALCVGESTQITATSANAGYAYVWTPGNLTGATQTVTPAATTTYTVTATDTTSGCVTTQTVTVNVNALPALITAAPATQTICEGEVQAIAVTGNVQANVVTIGTGTTAPGATSWTNPFSAWYGGLKTQILFTEAELIAQGFTPGASITTLSFEFEASVANALVDFRIKVGPATATTLTGLVASSALTTVYNANYTPVAGTTGWVPFTFTTPYVWNGGNLVVEVAHNAGNSGNGSGTRTRATTTTGNMAYYAAKDGVTPAGMASYDTQTTYGVNGTSTSRPNVRFNLSATNAVTWAPATGLYTNAAATQAYTAGTAATTVYAKPTATTTYTATATNASGCVVTTTSVITVNSVAAPVAPATQTFCGAATVASLDVEGTAVQWYTTATGGNALAGTTALATGTYYASQTVNGCQSVLRAAVAVTVNVTAAPEAAATQAFCNAATIADIDVTGTAVQWYADATATTPLAATTALVSGNTYYASQTLNSCEGPRAAVVVTINVVDAPAVEAAQTFCTSATVASLDADGINVEWFAAAEGGEELAADTALVNGNTYYAQVTVGNCSSATRTAVTVTITTLVVNAPEAVTACNSYELPVLTTGAYFTEANGAGNELAAGTVVNATTTLYVFAQSGECTAEDSFTITVTTTAAPTAVSPQVVTVDEDAATIEGIAVTAEGTVTWYASEEAFAAGTPLAEGTVIEAGVTYYAAQTIDGCTSAAVTAVVVSEVLNDRKFDMANFTYYPNPVRTALNIEYSSEITSVTVFNMLGQQVLSAQPNASNTKVDMTSLSEGTYFVKVVSGAVTKTVKVIKKQ